MSSVSMRARFSALKNSPRELKLIYVLKLLESFADFSISLNIVLFLTHEYAYSDVQAGLFYGAWGVATSVFNMLFAPLIDKYGVRRSLIVGGSLLTIGRGLLAFSSQNAHVIAALFVLQPAGMALAIPVLAIGIKRTTNDSSRSVAFGVFYAVMNVGALLSGLGTDAFISNFVSHGGLTGAIRALFACGCVTSAIYTLIVVCAFRDLHPVSDERVKKTTAWENMREMWSDRVFWKLAAIIGLLFGARSIFRHMDTTIPKWMQRTIGPHAHYGNVYAINPALVIVSVSFVQAYLASHDPYTIVLVGTTITTMAPLSLYIFPPSYVSAALFMVILSVGEVYYSSKIMEFGLMLAPEGKEGVYSMLATAPLFVVRLFSGFSSGGLLAQFCPANPPRHCGLMWLIITAISASTPLSLGVFKRCLYAEDVRFRIKRARQAADLRNEHALPGFESPLVNVSSPNNTRNNDDENVIINSVETP